MINNKCCFSLINYAIIGALFLLLSIKSYGQQNNDSAKTKKNTLVFVPVPFYYPETRFGLAVGGLYAFRLPGVDSTGRPSQIQVGGGYTQNKQVLSYINTQLYTKDLGYFIGLELGYYKYFFPFSGIGNEGPPNYKESYSVDFPRVRSNIYKRFGKALFLGLKLDYNDYKNLEFNNDGLLAKNRPTGIDAGQLLVFGVGGNYDTRDNYFSARKGEFIDYSVQMSNSNLLSRFDFARVYINAAKYQMLGKKTVMAVNLVSDNYFGNAPFFYLANLGGAKLLRGFYEGEVRNNHSLALQEEFRYQFIPLLGAVVFGGVGYVSPNLKETFNNTLHYTYGAGLRITINAKERLNARIDYGINTFGKGNFYFTFFEAF